MGQYADRCREVFKDELASIGKPELRDFVIQIFDTFGHEDFFIRPASRSGKYHPFMNLNDGGLVRHTKWAIANGDRVARYIGFKSPDQAQAGDVCEYHSVVIAALIVHDLMKDGDPSRKNEPQRKGKNGYAWIVGCHGVDLCEAIWKQILNGGTPTRDQLLVMMGIAGHMGRWTLPKQWCPHNLKDPEIRTVAEMVSMADYFAAQKVDEMWTKIDPFIWQKLAEQYPAPKVELPISKPATDKPAEQPETTGVQPDSNLPDLGVEPVAAAT